MVENVALSLAMAPENQTLHLPNVQLFSNFPRHFQTKTKVEM